MTNDIEGQLLLLALLMVPAGTAQTTTFETLYNFKGKLDGGQPMAGVLLGTGGQVYGTTYFGGSSGDGTVFELTPSTSTPWKISVIHEFSAADGANCAGTLVFGKGGALYGITTGGTLGTGGGNGELFELAPPSTAGGAWTETFLWNSVNLGTPNGTLAVDKDGAIYVTTQGIANYNGAQYGTIDSVTPPATPGEAWTGQLIYNFQVVPPTTGLIPFAGVIFDGKSLFGTTYYGGYCDCGDVYELSPPSTPGGAWTGTAIHAFTGAPSDGGGSEAALTAGAGGVLYGTTFYGGSGSSSECSFSTGSGCGTVFQLTPPAVAGGTWTESVIYSFTGINGDGAYPVASVVVGKNGELYGTTQYGGSYTSGSPCEFSAVLGCGTVFELTPPTTAGGAWTETVLHSFSGLDGAGSMPVAGLALSSTGALYGTTSVGGTYGEGTVFVVKP